MNDSIQWKLGSTLAAQLITTTSLHEKQELFSPRLQDPKKLWGLLERRARRNKDRPNNDGIFFAIFVTRHDQQTAFTGDLKDLSRRKDWKYAPRRTLNSRR
jgi:hypothetical protein